jgi:Mg2+ and Co2+ transporter CorA
LEYEQRIGSYEREKVELLSKVDSYQKQISELSHQTNSSNNEQSIQIMQLQQRFKEVNDGLSHTEKFYQSRIDQLTQDISRRSKEYEQKLE